MTTSEVIRCTRCRLVMFRGKRVKCPRCCLGLWPVQGMPVVVRTVPPPAPHALLTLGERVRAIRKRSRLSQRELAKRMASPRTTISKFECHCCNPTVATLIRLAVALGCNAGELLSADLPSVVWPDGPLVSFMAELTSYAGMLSTEQWVAVRRRARDLAEPKCPSVVIANSVEREAS